MMLRTIALILATSFFACTNQTDPKLKPAKNTVFDSLNQKHLILHLDSTKVVNEIAADTSMNMLELSLSELKLELKQNPGDAHLKNQIKDLEQSLDLIQKVNQSIIERDESIRQIIENQSYR